MSKSHEQLVYEAIMQYTNGKGLNDVAQQQQWELSANGRARAQEMVQRSGMTAEQARNDPGMMLRATKRALAEQRGQPEMNIGIDGRNGLSGSRGGVLVSKPLAERGNTGPDE